MGRSNDQTLKEAIQKFKDAYQLSPKLQEAQLSAAWEKLVGKSVASRTQEIYVNEKKLYLKLNSSVLRNELMFSKEKIIQIVNEEIGEGYIQEVVLF